MGKAVKYSSEMRERAVRMLREHEHEYGSRWAAVQSIAGKIGCTAQTLYTWARKTEPAVGDSYDNAMAETIIGLFKTDVIHPRGPWRTMDAVEYATLEWVDWFNNRRLLEPIGHVPPAEFEQMYYQQQSSLAKAA